MAGGPQALEVPDALRVTPDTVLVRARDVVVRLGDADDVSIVRGEDSYETTPHALAVLHAFAHPRTVADVLESAASEPAALDRAVVHRAAARERGCPPRARRDGRVAARLRASDHPRRDARRRAARTLGYIRALESVMKEGDVVVDIGTGTGVLAASAARAGARHVHAVESSAIADAAARVFATNGVADRVTLVRGRSTHDRRSPSAPTCS